MGMFCGGPKGIISWRLDGGINHYGGQEAREYCVDAPEEQYRVEEKAGDHVVR